MSNLLDVVVIGAGAAGLLAASRAAELGRRVLLLEKNRKAGVKILMSGGTRCNITQATDSRGIIEAFGEQGRFLHSPLAALPPEAVVDLFESEGVATKVEETGKIFPTSDKAADVLTALLNRLRRSGATLALDEAVQGLRQRQDDRACCEIVTNHRTIRTSTVIVTTGGQSYPGCGTTGDGYAWLQEMGHTIVPPRPALTPLKTRADWAKSLRGVTLSDVILSVVEEGADQEHLNAGKRSAGKKRRPSGLLAERQGGMLFAHFGLSGPAVLDVSRAVATHARPRSLTLICDFLPSISSDDLAGQLKDQAAKSGKKQIAGLLDNGLPRRLVDALVEQAGVPAERRAAELTRDERVALVRCFKQLPIPITGTLGFEKAEVTTGGVALGEVDSRTMQSKLVPQLFLAGEILDLDGPIGGYNFQSAFSTGYLAGESAASLAPDVTT